MFSQLRNAVEHLAQQPIRVIDAPSTTENSSESSQLSQSPDSQASRSISPLSSSQLAESALSSLRKSFASQRSISTPPNQTFAKALPSDSPRPHKSNLEERLRRATYAVGEPSNAQTQKQSSRVASPSPMGRNRKPLELSPASIPLPASPIDISTNDDVSVVDLALSLSSEDKDPGVPLDLESQVAKEEIAVNPVVETFSGGGNAAEDANTLISSPLERNSEIFMPSTENLVGDILPTSPNDTSPSVHKETVSLVKAEERVESDEVEMLHARLKQVEERFSDVSMSFKRLQTEKMAANAVLREITPLESINDAVALRDYFSNLKSKEQVSQDEIKLLHQKLALQEERFEEVRETHTLESHSRSDEIKKIQIQMEETEALFQASQRATSNAEDKLEKQKEEMARLHKEVEISKSTAKEEEEKRVKAISLLKTVRQKLVKAEKDKDDVTREFNSLRDKEKGDRDKEQFQVINIQHEMGLLKASHDKAITILKEQFGVEFTNLKEHHEDEISTLHRQADTDLSSLKSLHSKEIGSKVSQISTLENSLNNATRDKNAFFDQLQLRQAELESSQSHLESLQHQNSEYQFQLRESNDRLSLLKEEYSELLREQQSNPRDSAVSTDEIARIVSVTETKYEAKLSEMKRHIAILEKERYEGDADWSKKLKEKVKELEDLKRILGSAAKTREADESLVANLRLELEKAQKTIKDLQTEAAELPVLREQIQELKKSSTEHDEEINVKIFLLEKQLEEAAVREAQLKQNNKTIREELRKVQSSAALLERQRNPGVGYWTTRVADGNGFTESRTSISSPTSESTSRVSSPGPNSVSNKNEEEVNLEYLRNVILQFLEHKEMRPNLVKVLSIILHFTPQETRRLIAKV